MARRPRGCCAANVDHDGGAAAYLSLSDRGLVPSRTTALHPRQPWQLGAPVRS